MRPVWARPAETGYFQMLLIQKNVSWGKRQRCAYVALIREEKKRLLSEGVSAVVISGMVARVGVRCCSGCGRPMQGNKLEVR